MMAGIVLAAGEGRRMGGHPKAGVLLRGAPLLEHAVSSLRRSGCLDIAAVLPSGRPALVELAQRLEARAVVNPNPSHGMFSSVLIGLRHFFSEGTSIEAIAILPVDHPCVRHETISTLLTFARQLELGSVRPSFLGRGGHPLVLTPGSADELLCAPVSFTLRDALRAFCTPFCTLPTRDPGVLINVNTPDDLLGIDSQRRVLSSGHTIARASSLK
jgi:CTP:molybdopterin cytidylyltransferase MocA